MDRDFLTDLFADFGPVAIRRMFSGFGISADGINFALALRSGLYFRADEITIPNFEGAGSAPFAYQTRARAVTVNSYWQVPAHLFDDSDEFVAWARAALAAAQRAALTKQARARKPRRAKVDAADEAATKRPSAAAKRPAKKARKVSAKAKGKTRGHTKGKTKAAVPRPRKAKTATKVKAKVRKAR